MAMMEGCRKLSDEGLFGLTPPHTANSPIPGVILYMDEGHQRLEMLMADGTCIDLLKVYRLAEDCVRNWHKGDKMNLPHFVGDFGRLAPLAEALNGRNVINQQRTDASK